MTFIVIVFACWHKTNVNLFKKEVIPLVIETSKTSVDATSGSGTFDTTEYPKVWQVFERI